MTESWGDVNVASTSTSPSCRQSLFTQFPPPLTSRCGGSNVFRLLAWREISPRTKHLSKRLWGETSKCSVDNIVRNIEATDARHGLISWAEAESLQHLSAKYCPLVPPPRSTIAAAFSHDGKTLASTHGDHTVKIIDCHTGRCLKVLSGHRRTPWVVRFHPVHPEILASGSLDHEVRLWNANTAECIGHRDFYRPIASIAFHAQGEILAVASGHKLSICHYTKSGSLTSPIIVLKTRRSLRAVHFHPHAAPFLLTAEVNDLDASDSPMTLATSPGYLHYPPPTVLFANSQTQVRPNLEANVSLMAFPCMFWPAYVGHYGRPSLQHDNRTFAATIGQQNVDSSPQLQVDSNMGSLHNHLISPMEMSPVIPSSSNQVPEDTSADILLSEMENADSDFVMDAMEIAEGQDTDRVQQMISNDMEMSNSTNNIPPPTLQSNGVASRMPIRQSRVGVEVTSGTQPSSLPGNVDLQMLLRSADSGQLQQNFPFGDPGCWELPFLQGWLMGQTHAGLNPMPSLNDTTQENPSRIRGNGSDVSASELLVSHDMGAQLSSATATRFSQSRVTVRSGARLRSRSRLSANAGSGEGTASLGIANDESDPHPGVGRIESELATSLAAAAAAELPCTVKLRIWQHSMQDPCALLDADKCRLIIPHAVLCSEMGAHFSPCGRFLAACVACVLPRVEPDPGLPSQVQHDVTGVATSPTRHPISAHQVMYELRIYSLEKATFGSVLASRAIRAAHCLTSIQFSPTSEHILLAYGRRHSSLLRSIVVDGETAVPVYTILEIYRVSDMELVRVLPSAEDEVNVACFHPLVGGGLVYGTKEGKLRILQNEGSHGSNCTSSNFLLDENMLEVPTYALEC
ncbi:WD40 repeat [Cinnamomum micranthum f. kanehirae]|uniref:WD40 repeat n=1 Tax=Cinnamomum micranthum f. kanehirae TaxID=337451 RepID=A0A3S3PTD1_9MAGN|nr:WD40 repeat [Cinnamomum micranthum f. kanehirae]